MSVEAVVRHWARDARVLVVGDAMLDEYVVGDVSRISPEAPVPVVEVGDVVRCPGGAGNVAAILAGLGARVELCAVVGEDDDGERLRDILEREGVGVGGLVPLASQRTTHKQRVLCRGQQIMRCDYERRHGLSSAEDAAHAQLAASMVHSASAVVLSDYGKGSVSRAVAVETINESRRRGIPVAADPKGCDWSKYLGASAIKPNLHEAETMRQCSLRTDAEIEADLGGMMCVTGDMPVVLTRGVEGMSILRRGEPVLHCRTGRRPVRTVIGAGDVVAAVLALGMAAGADLADAASAANVMATAHCERGLGF